MNEQVPLPPFCPRRSNPNFAPYQCIRHETYAMQTGDYWTDHCAACIAENVDRMVKTDE